MPTSTFVCALQTAVVVVEGGFATSVLDPTSRTSFMPAVACPGTVQRYV
jgi:hypothetical protein